MMIYRNGDGGFYEWHVNEPIPDNFYQPHIELQADGQELDMILAAMEAGYSYDAYPVIPRCPKCGSKKLRCEDGHAWNIERPKDIE